MQNNLPPSSYQALLYTIEAKGQEEIELEIDMRIGVIGEPYFFYTSGRQIMFHAEETLFDFDIIMWCFR